MKTMFKATAIAALLAATTSSAWAAGSNTQITITGDVVPVSCDVTGGGTGTAGTVDLGNAAATEFVTGSGIYSGLKMVMANQKTFTVGVGGCSGTVVAGKKLYLNIVDAQSIAGSQYVLGGGAGSTTSSFGSTLAAPKTLNGTPALLTKGDQIEAFTYTSTDGAEADGHEVLFTATMASVATPSVGHAVAPVTFSLAYN
ncbi:hypothetical protein D3C79_129010 [compost metagenome]